MTVRTSVLWKIDTHMAKKWPGMVVQRTFIKGHSFVYRLYSKLEFFFQNPFLGCPWSAIESYFLIKIGPDLFLLVHSMKWQIMFFCRMGILEMDFERIFDVFFLCSSRPIRLWQVGSCEHARTLVLINRFISI